MGLVIVFLDIPPDGYDWIADPVGWVLVLLGLAALGRPAPQPPGPRSSRPGSASRSPCVSWPEDSVATLTPVLGWLFSLPTLAWCFLICDAVSDAVEGRSALGPAGAAQRLRWSSRRSRAGLPRRAGLALDPGRGARPRRQREVCSSRSAARPVDRGSSSPTQGPRQGPTRRPTSAGRPPPASRPRRRPSHDRRRSASPPRRPRGGPGPGARSRRRAGDPGRPSAPTPGAAAEHEAAGHVGRPGGRRGHGAPRAPAPSEPTGDQPVTGAEVIEKVRRRRAARDEGTAAGRPRHLNRRVRVGPVRRLPDDGSVDRTFCGGSVPPGDTGSTTQPSGSQPERAE